MWKVCNTQLVGKLPQAHGSELRHGSRSVVVARVVKPDIS